MHRIQFHLSEYLRQTRRKLRANRVFLGWGSFKWALLQLMYLRIRLTVTGGGQTQSQRLSQTFPRSWKAKISIVTKRGCRAEKIFVGMRLFYRQEEEKSEKELLGWVRRTALTVQVAWLRPRGREIPQGCSHFLNSPIPGCEKPFSAQALSSLSGRGRSMLLVKINVGQCCNTGALSSSVSRQ